MGAPCFGITPEDMGIYLATSDMIIGMSGIFFTDGPADARLAIRTFLGSAKEYWKKDFVWHFLSCLAQLRKFKFFDGYSGCSVHATRQFCYSHCWYFVF
jgi:hypothetical protein